MKNKLVIFFVLFFFVTSSAFSEKYIFEVSNIELSEKGNVINAENGRIISEDENLEILANKFLYFKDIDSLNAFEGEIFIREKNLRIKFGLLNIKKKNILTASDGIKINDLKNSLDIEGQKIVLDRSKNILTASDGIKINDLKNSLDIEGQKIVLDRSKNIIYSQSKTLVKDKNKNSFLSKKFKYKINKKTIELDDALIEDFENNKFEIQFAKVDLKNNKLSGEDIIINLNNKYMSPNNEPRLEGKKITYSNNITNILNGKFTTCKKREKCPPWELSADKITHDKKKKTISYQNVWLNIYDTPVVYFPKFFHPDPTVKRQSGFLMPSFKTSPNNNTFFSIPYFNAISENKDMTFTPRFYNTDKFLLQNEYRQKNKDSEFMTDFSVFADKRKIENHLFLNFSKKIDIDNFKTSDFQINIEQASNDTYLRANKLTSPIIKSTDVLENYFKINMSSDDTQLNSEVIIYEDLNRGSSDKYEYIFPRLDIVKTIQNKTQLDGEFTFKTSNFVHNYNTNILERVNTNDLIFKSTPNITDNGFYNNFEFIIKNSNTHSRKSKINKEGNDQYISGLFQFNSNLPLIKNKNNKTNLLKPKLSLKINPGHSKDLSKNDYKLNVNNIFNLDRISSNNSLENGISLAYGLDYVLNNNNNNKELLSMNFANNIRLNKNDDLEKNNQLGAKTSNIFGEIKFSPLDFLSAKYDFSLKNNLKDLNYQNLLAEIKFNKFSNTFDYVRQDGDKNSYFLNKTNYKLNESNNISFSTRENLKTNLTEYYNLVYEYKNDCLKASIEYQKDYYTDRDIKPGESIFFNLTIVPFGTTSSPNLKQ